MTAQHWVSGGVLVLGAKGMLGHELMLALRDRFTGSSRGRLVGYHRPELDIGDGEAVRGILREHEPRVVINAAAYTDVDGCEANPALADAVNAKAPGVVASACRDVGATMVHFGTDFVFDGRGRRPYLPDDPANPLSVYGQSKWAGEEAIRAASCRSLIIRTSWLFGLRGKNFVEAILSRASSGQPLRVVSDQVGCPTLASDLAAGVVRLLDAGAEGTVHFTNSGTCAWSGFAEEIIRQAAMDVTVEQITSDDLQRPAVRPAYSVLDLSRYIGLIGDAPAVWQDALARYLQERCARALSATDAPPTRDVPVGRAKA